MKIVRLESENIKGIRAVEIEPDGRLVVIGGKNEAGKSSVLDSIFYALGGGSALPKKPIRNGEKKARVQLDLGDIIVERTFTEDDSKVKVRSKDGASYSSPQAMLDALCSKLAFDPLEFSRLDSKKQAEQLRQLVGLDFSQLDARRKKFYEDRTVVNRQLAAAKAKLASAVKYNDAPKQELSVAELSDELERRQQHNEGIQGQREYVDTLTATIEDDSKLIEAIDLKIRQLKQDQNALLEKREAGQSELKKAESELAAMTPMDVDEIRQQIRSAGEINGKVAANRTHAELSESVAALEAESNDLTGDIEHIDTEKASMLQAAPFPVPGLGIDDSGVTLNGLPLEQASSAQRLRVSAAIGMAQKPKLRVMLIRDASLLDDDGLEIIAGMAEAQDYQVWLEKVAKSAEGCTVFIEDGAVKELAAV